MLELIQKIVYEVTGKQGLTPDTDFVQDLQLNSFDVINIIQAFERHYKIRIPTRDVWRLRRVQQVIDYLHGKGYSEP